MGNSCTQDCSTLLKDRHSEAFFDLDSEHAASSQVQNVQTRTGDLPRVGLGFRIHSSEIMLRSVIGTDAATIHSPSFPGKPSLCREDGNQANKHLLGGEVLSNGKCPLNLDPPEDASCFHERVKKTVSPEVMTNDSDDASVFTLAPPMKDLAEAESLPEPTSEPEPGLQPVPPSLELVCEVDGKERRMRLYRKPLGAEFSTKAAGLTMVSRVYPKSYASELGMAPGWILKSIGADDMTNKTFEQTQRALKDGLMPLPMRVKK